MADEYIKRDAIVQAFEVPFDMSFLVHGSADTKLKAGQWVVKIPGESHVKIYDRTEFDSKFKKKPHQTNQLEDIFAPKPNPFQPFKPDDLGPQWRFTD